MKSWEEVKDLPDDKILVYHVNGSIKLLPGIIREISPAGVICWNNNPQSNYDYYFVQLVNNSVRMCFERNELFFMEKV